MIRLYLVLLVHPPQHQLIKLLDLYLYALLLYVGLYFLALADNELILKVNFLYQSMAKNSLYLGQVIKILQIELLIQFYEVHYKVGQNSH